MTRQSANVHIIQTLSDLKGSLARFAGEAGQAMTAVEQEVTRTMEWLQERLYHWQREVEQWRQEVQRVRAALERCQHSGYYDQDGYYHAPDCSAYEAALTTAGHRLQKAEAELANTRRWMELAQQEVQQYHRHAQRLQRLTTTKTKRAQAFLERKRADLERYVAQVASASAQIASGDVGILRKMEAGSAALSKPTEWGKFAHRAYEEALEQAYPGQAESEISVTVERPTGDVGRGRIDSLLGKIIIDYKAHNLDRFETESELRRELEKIATQLEKYRHSPDTPDNATLVVLFEFPPSYPERHQFIETFFKQRGIQVLWDEE